MKLPTKLRPRAIPLQISGVFEIDPRKLKPHPKNPRAHTQSQAIKLGASIDRFGFTVPIIVDENLVILGGHLRAAVAVEKKYPFVPVRIATGFDEEEKLSYIVTENQLGLLSSWGEPTLEIVLDALSMHDDLLSITGFETLQIDIRLDANRKNPSPDESEIQSTDIPANVVTRDGDLWRLGRHYLRCGNALHQSPYDDLFPGKKADLVATDSPFNDKISDVRSTRGSHPAAGWRLACVPCLGMRTARGPGGEELALASDCHPPRK